MEHIHTTEDKGGALYYEAANHLLYLVLSGDISVASYKESFLKTLDYAAEHKVEKLLIDELSLTGTSIEARTWFINDYFKLIKEKLERVLVVVVNSKKSFFQVKLAEFIANTVAKKGANVTTRFFKEHDKKGIEEFLEISNLKYLHELS